LADISKFYPSPLGKLLMFMLMFEWCKVHCSLFSWITLWNLCHTLNRCKVAYFHGTLHDSYSMKWRKVRYVIFMDHAMKECEVANFHGQASDVYAYVWMVQGSLFSWITLWNLCHTLNRCKVAYFYGKRHNSYPMQRKNVR
jgi:hypothetical protein